MKIFLSALTAIAMLASAAQAGSYTHQRIGDFDYWNGDNGYSGTGQQIGQFYYYHDNYGSGTSQRIGDFDYYNYTPKYNYGW